MSQETCKGELHLKILENPPPKTLFHTSAAAAAAAVKIAGRIKRLKDGALAKSTEKLGASGWIVTRKEMKESMRDLSTPQFRALELACRQTGGRARKQFSSLKNFVHRPTPGWTITQTLTPLRSSALVLVPTPGLQVPHLVEWAVFSALAGIRERIVCVSPDTHGEIPALTLAAAYMTEVTRFYRLPPEEAMAALALEYTSVPAVDKILVSAGPKTAAMKAHLAKNSGTEIVLTGASELMILAEGQARPDLMAMEILAHVEKHPYGQCGVVSPEKTLLAAVRKHLKEQGGATSENARSHSIYLHETKSREDAVLLANKRAPEHIWLLSSRPEIWESGLQAYGVLHIGPHTAEVLSEGGFGPSLAGNYGNNMRGMLSVFDFVKCSLIEEIVPSAYKRLGKSTAVISRMEQRPRSADTALSRIELKPWHEPEA